MSRLIRKLIFIAIGTLAGIAAWPVLELSLHLQGSFPTYLLFSLFAGATFGAVFGAFFGAAEGIIAGNYRRIATGAGFGLLYAAAGGAIGFVLGQAALFVAGEGFLRGASDFELVGRPVARIIGWTVLGIFVGSSEGVRRRSGLKVGIGVLGGAIGGAVGGAAIEYAPFLISPAIARPVGLVVFGALIATAYGLIEHRLCSGVMRVLNGPAKGREFILNQRNLRVGTASGSDVYLRDYRTVADRHALLAERRRELYLIPEADSVVRINDLPVPQTGSGVLKYDDVIQVGSAKLLYRPLVMALFALLFALGGAGSTAAQSVRIAQIDSSRLLTQQRVDLYLSVSDAAGRPITNLQRSAFDVFESADGVTFDQVEITGFVPSANVDQGVTFYLLVDNSGSMYDTLDGQPTDDPEQMRMTMAVRAIRRFLDQIDNPRDRVALATFNTFFTVLAEPTTSIGTIDLLLGDIERPDRDASYTELYRSVKLAAEQLEAVRGRKVVIILSDGEDYPFARYSGRPHPIHGDELVGVRQTVDALQRTGSGAFGINFATVGDPAFTQIVTENGGLVYDADDEAALAAVYLDIRERVLSEYRVSYRAGIRPTDERSVRALVRTRDGDARSTRRYFAGTIFGLPGESLGAGLLIPFAIALLLAAGLTLLRFRNRRTTANVEVLNARGRATQVIDLTSPQTVIGSSDAADVTIAGNPDMKDRHATIVFDQTTHQYTVVSDQPISVNNQLTTRRRLTPGDVVQLPGATVVFDAPEDAHDGSPGSAEGKQRGNPSS
ncbi:MAG: VWA domain-containing protein [Spirochaetaceae bacterium]|nr:MAG: VWA domain-containing protein [Spirochaetaceae bacterium]